jgi:hexosaminidase
MASILFFLFTAFFAVSPSLAVWPLPRQFRNGSSPLLLSPAFTICVDISGCPDDLWDAVARTEYHLQNDKLERLVVGRGAADAHIIKGAKTLSSLSLSLTHDSLSKPVAEEAVLPIESRDETYTLIVPSDGSDAVLMANSTLGLYRGLTTFAQLWYYHSDTVYTLEAPIEVVDSPTYVRTRVFY